MGHEKTKRRRNYLFGKQNGKCHWCGCAMIHWNDVKADPAKQAKNPPKNLATLDHLRDRNHPGRAIPANGEQRLVIACWQCNFDRGKTSEGSQPIEILWEKSGRGPSLSRPNREAPDA